MSRVYALAHKYPSHKPRTTLVTSFAKIKANEKWIEYSLDLAEMSKLLSAASREERYVLLTSMTVAERKREWMYKHPNFKLEEASRDFKRAKKLLKI